jgi:hypothetical protein
MIMKTALTLFLCAAFTILIAGCSFAQANVKTHTWTATIKIVDGNGNPVPGAAVSVAYPPPRSPGQGSSNESVSPIKGLTDSNGVFVASHSSHPGFLAFLLGIRVQKPGYYSTWVQRDFGPGYNEAKWNPNITLVLKKIGKPIPMYAKKEETKVPKEDKPIGFDLKAGDWIAPYGTGKTTDIFFTIHRRIVSQSDYDCTLIITFPNKGDGIAVVATKPKTGSHFKTSRTAAESGYKSELSLYYSNTGNSPSVFGYFIRVCTKLNPDGTIKSALYGKIPGGFRFYAGTKIPQAGMGFNYYLNPTPNDRNLEFDPKQNLLRGLKPLEQVREP